MATHDTTRRALLKLGGGAAAYGAGATLVSLAGVIGTAHMTPAKAMTLSADAGIIRAWDTRQRAYAAYNALPTDDGPIVNGQTEAERRLWAIIDAAEDTIRSTVARTPRGAAIQLWCAMSHTVTTQEDDAAIQREDIAALHSREVGMDWDTRLALSALTSLIQMEA